MKTLGRCLQLLKATFQVILCRQAEISIHKANLIHRSPLITLLQSLFALKTLLRLNFDYLHVKFTYVRYMYGMDHTYVPGYVKFFQIRTEYFECLRNEKNTYQPRGNIAKILLLAKRRTTSSIIEIDYFSRIVFALLSYSSYITVVQKSLTKSFIRVYAASRA